MPNRLLGTSVAAALLLAACTSASDELPDSSSSTTSVSTQAPSTSPPATFPPVAAGTFDYATVGTPIRVSDGTVVGTTPDGTTAYVLNDDPEGETECEDAFTQRLFTVDLTSEAAEPALVTIDGKTPSGNYFLRSPAGHLALVDECEGFLRGIDVFDDDLSSMTELEGPDSDVIAYTMKWSVDGEQLVGHAPNLGATTASFALVSIDPVTGTREVIVEDAGPVAPFAELRDGAFIVADFSDSRIIERGGATRRDLPEAGDVTIGPAGNALLTFGDAVRVYDPEADTVSNWAEIFSIDGVLSPDGTAAVIRRLVEEADPDLMLVGPGVGDPIRIDAPAKSAVWLPDGSGFLYSLFSETVATTYRIDFNAS